jgi:hypothetical protein
LRINRTIPRILVATILAAAGGACGGYTGPVLPPPTSTTDLASNLSVCLYPMSGSSLCSQLSATPPYVPALNLGTVNYGATATAEIVVQNSGHATLQLAPPAFEGTAIPGLSVVTSTSGSESLPANAMTTYIVALTASAADQPIFSVPLDITFEGQSKPAVQITVFGIVSNPSGCTGQPPQASFVVKNHNVVCSPNTTCDFMVHDTAIFDASGSTPSTDVQYQWSLVTEPVGADTSISMVGALANLPLPASGMYEVSLAIVAGGCTSATVTQTLTVQ